MDALSLYALCLIISYGFFKIPKDLIGHLRKVFVHYFENRASLFPVIHVLSMPSFSLK